MRGIGLILVLLGLGLGGYFVAQNLNAVKGERAGKTVVEPLHAAHEAAVKVQKSLDSMQKNLAQIDK